MGRFILKLNISRHKESEAGPTSALVWMKVVVWSNNALCENITPLCLIKIAKAHPEKNENPLCGAIEEHDSLQAS